MKKIRKYLILIGFAAILGFTFSFLKHNGYWFKLTSGLKTIKWYLYPVIILFNFFIVILIHELGHLFSFVLNKIKIRALYVLVFVLMRKENDKWKFKIYPKHIKLLGGIVVPNIGEIKTEEDFNKIRTAFSNALIAGPRTSVGYLILSIIVFILIWFLTNLNLLAALLFINAVITSLMTVLIVLTSKVNTNEIYGDYVAYDKFLTDDRFALLQLIQYRSFSTIEDEETDKFLYDYLTNFYKSSTLSYHLFDLVLASNLLNFYLEDENIENSSVNRVINYYSINRLASSKNGLELAYLISAYYYKNNNAEKAFQTFKLIQVSNNKHIDEDKQLFLFKQYEHMLNLNNNEKYFSENKTMMLEELFILAPLVNVDEMIKDMSKTLTFVEYKTELYCNL